MRLTATTGKREDSDAAGTPALTREERCGARQARQSADLQPWLQKLQHEYGEQGSGVAQCDSMHTMMNIIC